MILDLGYRARQLAFRRRQISQWMENERAILQEEVELRKQHDSAVGDDFVSARVAAIEQEALRQEKDALATYGMLEGSDTSVAPLRRALAVWGLGPDDIGMCFTTEMCRSPTDVQALFRSTAQAQKPTRPTSRTSTTISSSTSPALQATLYR